LRRGDEFRECSSGRKRDPDRRSVAIANRISAIQALSSCEDASIDLNEPYVIAMGRLVKVRNFALLIDAFALSGVRGKLVILGEVRSAKP